MRREPEHPVAERSRAKRRWVLAVAAVPVAASLPWAVRALKGPEALGVAEHVDAVSIPADVDTLVSLSTVRERVLACGPGGVNETKSDCNGVIYVWSPEMPLSRAGIAEINAAARSLRLAVDVVPSRELYLAEPASPELEAFAETLLAAGATLHSPALVVHRAGVVDKSAILGYKSAAAYESLIRDRIRSGLPDGTAVAAVVAPASLAGTGDNTSNALTNPSLAAGPANTPAAFKDFAVAGTPGPYFRWVPGRDALAYEAAGQIYLLDLKSGERVTGPGYVDFVPTPDGRFFVTPGRNRALEFYDAEQVFSEARAGRGRAVRPFYVDDDMTDQYPSVGILSSTTRGSETRTVYRVLTSWFDAVVFRDYEVVTTGGRSSVRPMGAPIDACRSLGFSTPIMAPSGREVAGRDESTATTKVFRLADDGGCQEVVDLQAPTGKVAWDAKSERLAFAIPEGAVRAGAGPAWLGRTNQERAGIYVFERRNGSVERVEASLEARRLTFPEWVGDDQVAFLLPGEARGGPGRFRLVCCLR